MILGGFTAAGISLAVMSALFMRGSHEQALQTFIASALSTLPIAIALICYAVAGYTGYQSPLTTGSIFAGITIVLLMQIPGYAVGQELLENDVAAAKVYCESLIAPLDEYFNKHGHYPESIESLLPTSERPHLLSKNFYHTTEDSGYSFEVYDPAELMGFYDYSSEKRKWTHWTFSD
jgi:hypothetical protein